MIPAYAALLRADNPGPMTLDGTNSWVLRLDDRVIVVDPGPLLDEHLTALARHGPVDTILLTHGHPDHSEGVGRFVELTGAPVLARDQAYGAPLPPDGTVVEGLRVVPTPGHSGDSVSFLVIPEGDEPPALLTGDTVLGRGTTVVAHPDGRLDDYLASLRRLRALAGEHPGLVLLPGHGPVLADAVATLDHYLDHREQRLAAVAAAVEKGAETADDVVRIVYADVDPVLWPAAELSVRAQLDYLREHPRRGAAG